MITVLNASTSDRLVTVSDVQAELSTTSTNEALLGKLIDRASARASAYCGQPFTIQRYQVKLPSYGGVRLQLPHRNIRTIFFVRDGTDTGQDALSSTGYRVNAKAGQLERDEGWAWSAQFEHGIVSEPSVGNEYRRWLVEYSAGYIPADGKDSGSTWDGTTSTASSVPLDLGDAAIGLVRRSWFNRSRDLTVASERVGELSVTYRDLGGSEASGGMPSEVADLLAPYRSII